MTTTDADLVRAARSGDLRAFTALVTRHQDTVYAFVRSRVADPSAAEDVAQEVFIAAHKGLSRLEDESRPLPWLFGIARMKLLDHGRVVRRGPRADGADLDLLPARPGDGDAAALLADLMEGLSDEMRLCALLRFRDGLAYREIAHRLHLPEGTVATLLHRARERLAANHARTLGARS